MVSTTPPNDCSVKRASVAWLAGLAMSCTFSPAPVIGPDGASGDGAPLDRDCERGVALGGSAGLAGHTCVPRDDGRVMCFGSNDAGQLGDETTDDRVVPEPVAVPDIITVLAASSQHTCGRTNLGTLYCWGRNLDGQLGTGSPTDF